MSETIRVTQQCKAAGENNRLRFGQSNSHSTDPKSLTHDRFVGTPAFASPEQFEHSALDVRSDIYSLGETLWFALTGKTPFAGHSVEEIHRAQQSNALPIEQLKAAHVPSRLRSLLESMLAFEPASRPGTQRVSSAPATLLPEARSVRRTRVALAAAALLILGVSASFMFLSLRTQHSLSNLGAPEKSIAVLPFENLSRDPDNAYFADGIQDEILTRLSKISDLKVISRTSVMQYKKYGDTQSPRNRAGAKGGTRPRRQRAALCESCPGERAVNRMPAMTRMSGQRNMTATWPMCLPSLRGSLRRALPCCHSTILAKKNKTPISLWTSRMKGTKRGTGAAYLA